MEWHEEHHHADVDALVGKACVLPVHVSLEVSHHKLLTVGVGDELLVLLLNRYLELRVLVPLNALEELPGSSLFH